MDAIQQSPTADAQSAACKFTGDDSGFFKLVVRGGLLQLPTFGFYRFWLLTDVRRHLWANTKVGDDALEYTGRARELLIGFLIALAILVPLYLVLFWATIEGARQAAFIISPVFLILYALGYYGAYRARRYRLSRTAYRGLRLSMTGSGWTYLGRAVVWDLLTVVTLGLALPWRSAALERYVMRNSYYGDIQGHFSGSGGGLLKRGWWLWLGALASLAAIVGGFALLFYIALQAKNGAMTDVPRQMAAVPALIFAASVFSLFILPLYRAIDLRWRLNGIALGETTLSSTLGKGKIIACYMKSLGWSILLGFGFSIIFGILIFAFAPPLASLQQGEKPLGMTIVGGAGYLLLLVSINIIYLHYVTRGVWAAAVNSLTVHNLAALHSAAARGVAADSVGEGLADALDFGTAGI